MKPLSNVLTHMPQPIEQQKPQLNTSLILPLGLQEMVGTMTPEESSLAAKARQQPMGRAKAQELLSSMQRAMSWVEWQWVKEQTGDSRYPEVMKKTFTFNIPEGYTVEHVRRWVVEALRPCHPMVLTEISNLISRKRPFDLDSAMTEMILQQTYEQLTRYSEAVFYWTIQDARNNPTQSFPQHHEFERWAKENQKMIQFLDAYFMEQEC